MSSTDIKIYLVGGAVRDRLLNYPSHDRDWVVVGARPDDLLAQGYQQVGKDFPVFLHPHSKEEYALARRERKQGSGYHGFICEFGPDISLEEDLSRRDLRINAMALDDQDQLIDPYGGQQDIEQRLLRHISPAFAEDPLRVFRVARYAARYAHLGFTVAPETVALMQQMSASRELQTLAAERLWTELSRALGERRPAVFFQVLLDCDALASLFPQWPPALTSAILRAVDQAAATELGTEIRFAISCSGLSFQDCRQLCQALRCSKGAAQLAELYAAYTPLPPLREAEACLQFLERMDYLRRPQLLADFCAGAALLEHNEQILTRLQGAAEALRQIQASALSEQGLRGPELGQALRQQRLDTLTTLLG